MPRLFARPGCWWCVPLWLLMLSTAVAQNDSDNAPPPAGYTQLIVADQPTAYWTFDGEEPLAAHSSSAVASSLKAVKTAGQVKLAVEGPRSDRFPLFDDKNNAAQFFGDGGRIVVDDPGDDSAFDFKNGDAITLEAWVNCTKLGEDQQVYLIGKGRTNNEGVAKENQNWALRLRGQKGQACVSFLFRSADNRPGERDDFHRWNTKKGFAVGSGWHHVAVTYRFGDPKSVRGYIDGEKLDGTWDYGGPTEEEPVVDNDQVWIGSSLGGSPSNTLVGMVDEIALYRTALSAERIATRFKAIAPKSYTTDDKLIPEGEFLVEVFEGIPDKTSWDFPFPDPVDSFRAARLAFLEVPHKYNAHGVREDRTNPFVLRASGWATFPPEDLLLILRSRDAVRLFIDDKLVGQNPFFTRGGDGHNALYPTNVRIVPNVSPLKTGDQEQLLEFRGTGKPQRVTLEVWCGGRGRRPEVGETVLAFAKNGRVVDNENHKTIGTKYSLFTRASQRPLPPGIHLSAAITYPWEEFLVRQREDNRKLNQHRRLRASQEYARYWEGRHRQAQRFTQSKTIREPTATNPGARINVIDDYINLELKNAGIEPLPIVDDGTFLRRVSLDTIGTNPPADIVDEFFSLPANQRRAAIIDRLLAHEAWADHWTSYWQDVLAENPNVINPTLNNTGPFRWWIHESLEDNKPLDRFATELILMEGSLRGGGPAGFSMASQNDAPMAAKAHVIAQAFMGMEMKCARCHDAPYHDFTQKQLFSLAAMLKRSPEQLPKSSTIPGDPNALKSLMVKVTLKPGEKIPPEWPFAKIIDGEGAVDLLQDKADQRQRLAALVTSPQNHRFAQVMANRIWARYFGKGLVDPVDDWEQPDPTHPELLEHLERVLVSSGYDMKALARHIFNSHTYQRQVDVEGDSNRDRAKLLAGTRRRRLTAEQVVDSLFDAAGKPLNVEDQNIDVDGGRKWDQSINLGPVRRAWQFASLSNERDRPSLSLPATQTVLDVLEAFGWRSTRPDPLTVRTVDPSVLQAAVLENGVVGKRIKQLSDDSAFTKMALEATSPEALVDAVYQRILVRKPTVEERDLFVKLLTPGFEERVIEDAPVRMPNLSVDVGVSWSNHLKPEANERKTKLKEQLEAGDPVTARLAADWRERAEDMIWTLINTPEFVLVP